VVRRAAAMGDPDVLLDLGKRYESGSAVPRNLAKAILFYRRVLASKYATEDGKTEARTRLAALGWPVLNRALTKRGVRHKR